jgi:DNA polymerase
VNKQRRLALIARQIAVCRRCRPKSFRGKPVPGEGLASARVVFVGEAPGKQENASGRPFVGRSGKFLDGLFKRFGIDRSKAYITSVSKYYPGLRKPNAREIEACRPFLEKQLEAIRPKLIVLLGDVALQWFFPKLKLRTVHGKRLSWKGTACVPTFHPAAGMRFPKVRRAMHKDFRIISARAKCCF